MDHEPLDAVMRQQAACGELPQLPCGEDQLTNLRERARLELGADLPADYLEFLGVCDGLNHNGCYIYGSRTAALTGAPDVELQGIVEANLDWRSERLWERTFVFGEGSMDLYVRDAERGGYVTVDRSSGTIVETHASFGSMLAAALASIM